MFSTLRIDPTMPLTSLRFSHIAQIALCFAAIAMPAHAAQSDALRDLEILSSPKMQGRETGSEGSALAQQYIIQRLKELGLKPCGASYLHEFTSQRPRHQPTQGKNILACQNADDVNAKTIVVSAHYDHLGRQGVKTYLGADDNASGVAGVLAIAKNFQTQASKHHLIYAFFDAEEQGLLGAFAFLKNSPIPHDKIALNINLDMIARGDKNELYISGTHRYPHYKTLLQPLNGTHGIKLLFGHDKPEQGSDDWTPQSDHYAFFKAGIPHLYFGVEDHADYHKPSDSFDKINPQFFDGVIALLIQASRLIDQQP